MRRKKFEIVILSLLVYLEGSKDIICIIMALILHHTVSFSHVLCV